tara:strand:+ start:618 stop:740 length:123 start_codon:yes stop_codon:yes gene_type:complete
MTAESSGVFHNLSANIVPYTLVLGEANLDGSVDSTYVCAP